VTDYRLDDVMARQKGITSNEFLCQNLLGLIAKKVDAVLNICSQ
jgi:hypothetical protein